MREEVKNGGRLDSNGMGVNTARQYDKSTGRWNTTILPSLTPEEQAACQRLLAGKGTNADMKTMAKFSDDQLVQLGFKPNGRMITMRNDPKYASYGWAAAKVANNTATPAATVKVETTPAANNVAVNQANSVDNQAAMVQNTKDKNAEIAAEQTARPAETITARLDAFEARLQKLEAALGNNNTGAANSNYNIPPQLSRDTQGNIISGVTQ